MKTVTNDFLSILEKTNVRYEIITETYDFDEENDFIKIVASGENFSGINTAIIMNNEDAVLCFANITKVPPNKKNDVLNIINAMNEEYRWIKFFINEDNFLYSQTDVIFEEFQGAEICAFMILRLVNIIDAIYPDIMRAIW